MQNHNATPNLEERDKNNEQLRDAMRRVYKTVDLYVDKNSNLLAVPYGDSIKYSLAGLDLVLTLSSPYFDEELESFLLEAYAKMLF